MRGQEKIVKSLFMTGKVYLKYEDDELIGKPEKGDVYLYINTDSSDRVPIKGNYFVTGYAGYFRADIYDGKAWQVMDINDFLEEKENYFSKTECSIDTFRLCQEILQEKAGTELYKGYRGGHYSTYLHVAGEYKGKKGKR